MMKNHLRPFVPSFFSCSNVSGIREKFFKAILWGEMKKGVLFEEYHGTLEREFDKKEIGCGFRL